jgi:hypothetical protein
MPPRHDRPSRVRVCSGSGGEFRKGQWPLSRKSLHAREKRHKKRIFEPVAIRLLVKQRPVFIGKSTRTRTRKFQSPQFPFPFRQRFYEKQPDHVCNSEIICRRDFLQHVGWRCHAIYFVGFRTHLQRLSAKRFVASSILSRLFFVQARTTGFNPRRSGCVKTAKTDAVTVGLDRELKGRLARASTKLDLSQNDIVRHALRAAVNAIEANDYKIELPLEMSLRAGPALELAK